MTLRYATTPRRTHRRQRIAIALCVLGALVSLLFGVQQ